MLLPTIVDVSPKGQILIPADIRKALGVIPRGKVFIFPDIEEKKMVVEALEGENIIKYAYGMLRKKKGKQSMVKELLEERRRDLETEERRINYFKKKTHD